MTIKNKPARKMPIRFNKLNTGSMFRIAAEPSRGIHRSDDTRVYQKVHPVHSQDTTDRERHIILDQDDLVFPLTRGW